MTEDDSFTVPVPDPEDQMDAIRKRNGEGRHMRFPYPRDVPVELDPSGIDRDLAMSRWLRDWRWSQQFAPPGPLIVVTGI